MAYTNALAPTLPANDDPASAGALALRTFKAAMIERLETVYADLDADPLVPFAMTQNVGAYGAVGNGVTDDRVAIQLAIDTVSAAGGGIVALMPGATHALTAAATTVSAEGISQHFCLKLPNNVKLVFQGATLQKKAGQHALTCMVINSGGTVTENTGIGLIGPGTIDCNQANAVSHAPLGAWGFGAGIGIWNSTKTTIRDITVLNFYGFAGRILSTTQSTFFGLRAYAGYGEGWSLGVASYGEIEDCQGDLIYGENILPMPADEANLPGNGIVLTAIRCQFGAIAQKNCGGGIKIQDTSADITVGESLVEGGVNTTGNSGTKVQGGVSGRPKNIAIGAIVSVGNAGYGGYWYKTDRLSIGSYIGSGNATLADREDVRADENTGLRIGSFTSRNPGVGCFTAASATAGDVQIGRMYCLNPIGAAVTLTGVDHITIDLLRVDDDQGSPTLTTGLNVTVGTGRGSVRRLEYNLAFNSVRTPVALVETATNWDIGEVVFTKNTDPTGGLVTLTAGATTAVANKNVWKTYNGGASNYVHPLLELIPWNAAARTLLGTIGVGYAVTDLTSGGGFSITTTGAAGTEKFFWRLIGYRSISAPSA